MLWWHRRRRFFQHQPSDLPVGLKKRMTTFRCTAILFDLDGVLVDSTRSVVRQWRRWANENGLDPERVVSVAHGVRTVEVVRLMAPHLDAEAEAVALEKREAVD